MEGQLETVSLTETPTSIPILKCFTPCFRRCGEKQIPACRGLKRTTSGASETDRRQNICIFISHDWQVAKKIKL